MKIGKLVLGALLGASSISMAEVTHSWTFNDGTANDYVGGISGVAGYYQFTNANSGALLPDTSGVYSGFSGGQLVLTGDGAKGGGFIDINGPAIAINTYSELTVETWATKADFGEVYSTLVGFWGPQNVGVPNNALLLQSTRADGKSRALISLGTTGSPWSTEDGVDGPQGLYDQTEHHYVFTVTSSNIAYYVDGAFLGTDNVIRANNANMLSGVGTEFAAIGRTGYLDNPIWSGSVNELNIYNNALSSDDVLASFNAGPVAIPEPATFGLIGIVGAGVIFVRRRLMI